jgi:Putative quorum-sensing-regulated virulence factor
MSNFAGAFLQLPLRPIEVKLLTLALDPAARGNEIVTSATKLIDCLRTRGISAAEVFRASKLSTPSTDNGELARAGAMRMPFGKYKHKPLRDVPLSYLRWARDNCKNMSASLRDAISVILKGD